MYIYSEKNNYPFSNTVISITDNTRVTAANNQVDRPRPRFNFLFPIMVEQGPTNQMEHFYPGEERRFAQMYGEPGYITNGIASEMIYDILASNGPSGVYVVNLTDPASQNANIILLAKTKVLKDVPVTNDDGEPLYLTPDGRQVTTATDNTPIVKDMLSIKYDTAAINNLKGEVAMYEAVDGLYTGIPDAEGYITYPLLGFIYDSAGTYGNSVSMTFTPVTSEYTRNIYYKMRVEDAHKTVEYSANISFSPDITGEYFVANVVNRLVPNVTAISASYIEEFFTQLKSFLAMDTNKTVNTVDIFTAKTTHVVVEDDSFNPAAHRALQFVNGVKGPKTFTELAKALFASEIIPDITSLLRYRINYIVDVGYEDSLKTAIQEFCSKRIRTTLFCCIVGSETSFDSAIQDSIANYAGKYPTSRYLAGCQSGIAFSQYTRRMHRYPPSYFDTMGFLHLLNLNGHPYTPFAGADARWRGFNEKTVEYPSEATSLAIDLNAARINVVKRDTSPGAYLIDQLMGTAQISDLTEFNNALIMADMIYDVVELIHRNNFTFNEAPNVALFKEKVDLTINTAFAPHSASLGVEVYRMGETGIESRTNVIELTVDFKDIGKFAVVQLTINDN